MLATLSMVVMLAAVIVREVQFHRAEELSWRRRRYQQLLAREGKSLLF